MPTLKIKGQTLEELNSKTPENSGVYGAQSA